MKRCKHPFFDRFIETKDVIAWPDNLTMIREYCGRCGFWMSLGNSDEHASEQVEIEIRAAELAARRGFGSFSNCGAGCERCGFIVHKHGVAKPPDVHCDDRQFHAGYLARAIATHEEQP